MAGKGNDKLRKLTTDEAREIGQKGGKASGESRRARKTLKEELTALLSLTEEGQEESTNNRISVSLIKEALKGNVKAFEVIRDTIGEKPVEKQEHTFPEGDFEIAVKNHEDDT